MKEEAYVYCGDRSLYYEDPAGDYKVDVMAQDWSGKSSIIATNLFEYTAMNAFDVDFINVDYGNVKLNTLQGLSGDLDMATAERPTVRNLGNTRLYIGVEQDDMNGLGTTNGVYNVSYQARVGNEEADWKGYDPSNSVTWLQDILDLSEDEEMDFTIFVTKWPIIAPNWQGTMTLSAKSANFRECYNI